MNSFDWSSIRTRLGIKDSKQVTTYSEATIKATARTVVDELVAEKISLDELRHDVLKMQAKSAGMTWTEPMIIVEIFDLFFATAMARIEELHVENIRLQIILEEFEVISSPEDTELEEWDVITGDDVADFVVI
ncbi:hypothetical protein QBC41DRAFT_302044 [Cercophora samala]|uniref:Uncharacterized protein n=1 Tax=Cercophora samala TaxID=330535 RepID=A0AA40DDP7_9PEZI|nr:hypothetical protein QBC41DRAFT_302044 [Cercophora samala]